MTSAAESLKTLEVSADLRPGHRRFIKHLGRLMPCLVQASVASSPALALFETPARQWLFYLQSLCRVYREVQGKKPFKALAVPIKALEDQLGAVDYWDAWLKEAATKKGFPARMKTVLKRHKSDELAALQKLIDEDGWFANDFERVRSILETLGAVEWHKPAKDRRKVAEFLADELKEIETEYREGEIDFAELELGVHEFRRQIRWISIYAQSLDGLVQLRATQPVASDLQKYMTKAVLESPYNVLPPPVEGIEPVYLSAPHFYALSWVIAEIGIIKDDGLKIEAFTKAGTEAGLSERTIAPLVRDCKHTLGTIPDRVAEIARTFIIKDAVLKGLMA